MLPFFCTPGRGPRHLLPEWLAHSVPTTRCTSACYTPRRGPRHRAAVTCQRGLPHSLPTLVQPPHPQGVGRATALLFARKGWNVVVAARDASKLAYVVEDCAAAAGRAGAALAVPTDVTQVGWWWWWWGTCVRAGGGGGEGGSEGRR